LDLQVLLVINQLDIPLFRNTVHTNRVETYQNQWTVDLLLAKGAIEAMFVVDLHLF